MLVFADIFLYLYLFVCQNCCLGAELPVNDMFTSPALTQSRGMCLYLYLYLYLNLYLNLYLRQFDVNTVELPVNESSALRLSRNPMEKRPVWSNHT